jgi:hypothetical protein
MGQIRTPECELIDQELRALLGDSVAIETQKDTYSLDYMVFVTAADEVHPIRVTVEEYESGDWKCNVKAAVELLTAQSATGEDLRL